MIPFYFWMEDEGGGRPCVYALHVCCNNGFLMIGAAYNDKYPISYYPLLSLRKSFDVIIHIQKVTASQLLPLEE